MNMLDFLLENSVHISSELTPRKMFADEAFEIGGEYVVYEDGNPNDIYRGTDFDEAMKFLNGDD